MDEERLQPASLESEDYINVVDEKQMDVEGSPSIADGAKLYVDDSSNLACAEEHSQQQPVVARIGSDALTEDSPHLVYVDEGPQQQSGISNLESDSLTEDSSQGQMDVERLQPASLESEDYIYVVDEKQMDFEGSPAIADGAKLCVDDSSNLACAEEHSQQQPVIARMGSDALKEDSPHLIVAKKTTEQSSSNKDFASEVLTRCFQPFLDCCRDADIASIKLGASFSSYAEFYGAFSTWMDNKFHPLRITSSENLRDMYGQVSEQFKYKTVVFSCVHAGTDRSRGLGKRKSLSYMHCECPALVRVQYDFQQQVLRIVILRTEHTGHPVTKDYYNAVGSHTREGKKLCKPEGVCQTPFVRKNPRMASHLYATGMKQEMIANAPKYKSILKHTPKAELSDSFNGSMQHDLEEELVEDAATSWKDTAEIKQLRDLRTPVRHVHFKLELPDGELEKSYNDDLPLTLPNFGPDVVFPTYAHFDAAFDEWKEKGLHIFRIASSEKMRDLHGTVNNEFRYRYVVFNCVHYGQPRMRGLGARPNQLYLPSGCRASFRLAYSIADRGLKITTFNPYHQNHQRSRSLFDSASRRFKSRHRNHRFLDSSPLYSSVTDGHGLQLAESKDTQELHLRAVKEEVVGDSLANLSHLKTSDDCSSSQSALTASPCSPSQVPHQSAVPSLESLLSELSNVTAKFIEDKRKSSKNVGEGTAPL